MESLLASVHVPNTRICAVDGTKDIVDPKSRLPITGVLQKRSISRNDEACSRSHLKAIKHLQHVHGQYFLVVEDDVIFDNMKLLPFDLAQVIRDSPPFDILQISKTYHHELRQLYTPYEGIYAGCQAYVISRSGVQKITNLYPSGKPIRKRSEHTIFDPCITYTYKYNLIDTLCKDSTLHPTNVKDHARSKTLQRTIILKDFPPVAH
jgi:GR25 family glycosyltransferase involved in LPS biosynthesis